MYGGETPKRHMAFANSPGIQKLDLGKLEGWAKKVQAMEAAGVERTKTVKKYIDKKGRQRFQGSAALKPTESETQFVFEQIWQSEWNQVAQPTWKLVFYCLPSFNRSLSLSLPGTIPMTLG